MSALSALKDTAFSGKGSTNGTMRIIRKVKGLALYSGKMGL
jgi:hypothetical protein